MIPMMLPKIPSTSTTLATVSQPVPMTSRGKTCQIRARATSPKQIETMSPRARSRGRSKIRLTRSATARATIEALTAPTTSTVLAVRNGTACQPGHALMSTSMRMLTTIEAA